MKHSNPYRDAKKEQRNNESQNRRKNLKNRNYSTVSLFLDFLFRTNCYIFSIDYVHSLYTQKSFFFHCNKGILQEGFCWFSKIFTEYNP